MRATAREWVRLSLIVSAMAIGWSLVRGESGEAMLWRLLGTNVLAIGIHWAIQRLRRRHRAAS